MVAGGADQSVPGATVRYLLAAVAAAWALGISPELIAAGLETYDPAPRAAR
jgi:cyanophycin synthetase